MVNNKPLILLHKAMPSIESSLSFDVMLSPQFYTLKRESIPVRFHFQAKKLAPSILENLLPADGKYDYYVFKDGDSWAFIAYDINDISTFLQSRGAAPEKVSKLYFAQQSVDKFTLPVLLNEDEVLTNIQGIATVVPKMLLSDGIEYQEFSQAFRPAKGKTFGTSSHSLISEKEAWIIGGIFLLFAMMFTAEGIRYRNVIATMQEKVSTLLNGYPALQSQYARENIAQKYHKIDKEERHKREILKGLSRLMLPGVQVETLLMEGKHFSSTLKCPDEKTVVRVQSLAKEKQYKTSRIGSENLVKIEGNL